MKKIGGYPHNGYPTDMSTCTGQIFIQRVGYEGATIRTIPAPLKSLLVTCVNIDKKIKLGYAESIPKNAKKNESCSQKMKLN